MEGETVFGVVRENIENEIRFTLKGKCDRTKTKEDTVSILFSLYKECEYSTKFHSFTFFLVLPGNTERGSDEMFVI